MPGTNRTGAGAGAPAPGRPTAGRRRRPVQRRSAARVERLLDATAEVLDEVGFVALTTREVARRAEVPIGTLYQFFDGKQALCAELARRNLVEFLTRLGRRFEAEPIRAWHEASEAVVAEFVTMKRTVPGFAAVDFGDARPGQPYLLDPRARVDNNSLVAARLAAFGLRQLGLPRPPRLAPGELDRVLVVAVELADSLLRLAFRADPAGDPALIAEAGRALRGYLADRLG